MAGAYPCRSHRHHIDRRSPMKVCSRVSGCVKKTPLFKRGRSQNCPRRIDIIIDDASHFGDLTKIAFWHLLTTT